MISSCERICLLKHQLLISPKLDIVSMHFFSLFWLKNTWQKLIGKQKVYFNFNFGSYSSGLCGSQTGVCRGWAWWLQGLPGDLEKKEKLNRTGIQIINNLAKSLCLKALLQFFLQQVLALLTSGKIKFWWSKLKQREIQVSLSVSCFLTSIFGKFIKSIKWPYVSAL